MVEANPEYEGEEQEQEEQKTFIDEPAILDKFKAAAVITDGKSRSLDSIWSPFKLSLTPPLIILISLLACLAKAVELAIPGADIATICNTIDAMIEEEVKRTFSSKKSKHLERGIAFPTCISVNHVMGHYSPLLDESTVL